MTLSLYVFSSTATTTIQIKKKEPEKQNPKLRHEKALMTTLTSQCTYLKEFIQI